MRPVCFLGRTKNLHQYDGLHFISDSLFHEGSGTMKLLLQNGWHVVNINGSHHKLRKGNATEIIPIHGKDVPSGLLNAILKRTGLK